MFIRVRDTQTRHEFDVPETDWRIDAGHFEPIKARRYPPASRPRAPKHYTPAKNVNTPKVEVQTHV